MRSNASVSRLQMRSAKADNSRLGSSCGASLAAAPRGGGRPPCSAQNACGIPNHSGRGGKMCADSGSCCPQSRCRRCRCRTARQAPAQRLPSPWRVTRFAGQTVEKGRIAAGALRMSLNALFNLPRVSVKCDSSISAWPRRLSPLNSIRWWCWQKPFLFT